MSTRGSSAFGSRGRGRGAQSAAGGTREPLTTSNIPPSRGRGRGGGRVGASAATSTTPRGGAQSRNTSASYATPRAAFNTNNSASATATATASSDRVEIDLLSDEDDNNHGNSRRDKQRGGASMDEEMEVDGEEEEEEEEEEDDDTRKTIPPELLTRLLHELFEKDETRITRDANDAVAKYVDVFVREAIARAAAERGSGTGGFLEVEDLEKIAPQLLLDL
ncbi:CENP-S associating centromere protein X-domain-containing protein [Rhypophila decipiens]|uniref:CENP-S associating centromere protein X-domain-containing protein n=1 Tax=Rhypophila decipiens TaxID=261697 RepID=A0AAN6Y6L0_9PEZI|nr:CENP-S associating centromere protein X-domain-containing protein [Rhypophila decipiens]